MAALARERTRQIRTAIVLPLAAILLAVLIGSFFVYAAAWIKDGKIDPAQPLIAYRALARRLAVRAGTRSSARSSRRRR